jgi:ubiquinone/menaquinone biosynthesis C-methylase UbiE
MVNQYLLDSLQCPVCGNFHLQLIPTETYPCFILECTHCHWEGKRDEDCKLYLHRQDSSWDLCLAQIEAIKKFDTYALAHQEALPAGMQSVHAPTPKSILLNQAMLHIIKDNVGSVDSLNFLDLGASTGWATEWWLGQGANYGAALDINESLLPPSRPGLVPIIADGYHIPFQNETFDFVFDCSSLHHFADLPTVVGEVHRILKPGGWWASQGNPSCKEKDVKSARERQDWYMQEFGLIEIMPTEKEYQEAIGKEFSNIYRMPVEDNMVRIMRK